MRFEVCSINHQAVWWAVLNDQSRKNLVKHAHLQPIALSGMPACPRGADKPVVQGLMWPIGRWRIPPAQTISDHMNDAADDFALSVMQASPAAGGSSTRGTPCDKGNKVDPRQLFFTEPKLI